MCLMVEEVQIHFKLGQSHVFASDATFTNIETVLAHASGSSINLSAQSEGFTITGGAGVDALTGGTGVDIISGGAGDDTLTGGGVTIPTGGAGNDTFNVDSGVDSISDLTTGDILVVSSGATANATFAANFVATNASTNAGTANLTAAAGGKTIDMSLAGGSNGFNIISGSGGDTLKGGGNADTFTIASSGEGNSDVLMVEEAQIHFKLRPDLMFCPMLLLRISRRFSSCFRVKY